MITPYRIQLSRKKGFNLQALSQRLNGLEAVKCCRPSRYGNPFVINADPHFDYTPRNNAEAVKFHREWIAGRRIFAIAPPTKDQIKLDLRGKNLACFCPLDQPCHVDTLLEIANEKPMKANRKTSNRIKTLIAKLEDLEKCKADIEATGLWLPAGLKGFKENCEDWIKRFGAK